MSTAAPAAPEPLVESGPAKPACRACGANLNRTFVDLGSSPLANDYPTADQLRQPETFYPLRAYVCDGCLLVQLEQFESPERIFEDYAYFSSYSATLLEHSRRFASNTTERLGIGNDALVVEVASNDGYLLQYFLELGIPVLGIEPAANVASAALARGVPTVVEFFGSDLARRLAAEGREADLLIANNVLAHVPDLNDFVVGLKLILAPGGVLTMEFPHLLRLLERNQFDTIYHEHLSYFSLLAVKRVFESHGLTLFDVDELGTHGGSLRIYCRHDHDDSKPVTEQVEGLEARERNARLGGVEGYVGFADRVQSVKRSLLTFLIAAKEEGRSVVGYGAAAKASTLLNYCGIRTDLIDYVVDASPHKQGRYVPGVRIPIYPPGRIAETQPDYLLLLAWNIKDEIIGKSGYVREWGGRFVVPTPQLEIVP